MHCLLWEILLWISGELVLVCLSRTDLSPKARFFFGRSSNANYRASLHYSNVCPLLKKKKPCSRSFCCVPMATSHRHIKPSTRCGRVHSAQNGPTFIVTREYDEPKTLASIMDANALISLFFMLGEISSIKASARAVFAHTSVLSLCV